MAVLSDYTSGTISLANGSTAVTGTGTLFDVAKFREGDTLQIENLTAVIASVNSNTSLTLAVPWTGTTLTDAPYRARYLSDGARVTAQATTLIELLGNGVLSNLAEIGVEDGKTPVGNAAGEYELKDYVGDPNGSLEKLAALALAGNKAITTDGSGNAQQINLGTLGRALLALASGTTAQYVRGDGTLQTLDKVAVGLSNVDNTSDVNKPVSTAMQTALNGKANISGATITGTYNFQTALNVLGNNFSSSATVIALKDVNSTSRWSVAIGSQASQAPLYFASFDFNGNFVSDAMTLSANGNVNFPGALTAGSKSFEIDHPLDPFNKDLVFMSTEAPKAGVEFWGAIRLIDGVAEVDIDHASNLSSGTFDALTQNAIAMKPNNLDSHIDVRASRIVGGKFSIIANDTSCQDEVSWHVKAERADAFIKSSVFCDPSTGLLIPEREKEDAE